MSGRVVSSKICIFFQQEAISSACRSRNTNIKYNNKKTHCFPRWVFIQLSCPLNQNCKATKSKKKTYITRWLEGFLKSLSTKSTCLLFIVFYLCLFAEHCWLVMNKFICIVSLATDSLSLSLSLSLGKLFVWNIILYFQPTKRYK